MEEIFQAMGQTWGDRSFSANDTLNLVGRKPALIGQPGQGLVGAFEVIVPKNLAGVNGWNCSMHCGDSGLGFAGSPTGRLNISKNGFGRPKHARAKT